MPLKLEAQAFNMESFQLVSAETIISGSNHIMFNLVAIALTHFVKTGRVEGIEKKNSNYYGR